MKRLYRMAVSCLLGAILVSCQTISQGPKSTLRVESIPTGAHVTTSTGYSGVTPADIEVTGGGDFQVTVEQSGYESVTIPIHSSEERRGWSWKGFALAGVIGGAAGHKVRTIEPNIVEVELVALPPEPEPSTPEPVAPEPPQDAGKQEVSRPSRSWALVVGIADYQQGGPDGLSNLAFADEDARGFQQALLSQGWDANNIKLLVNEQATKRNVEVALEAWLTKTEPEDRVVLFWAGHGFPDPENPAKVYFACYDTDINVPATGYRMDRVRQALEERAVRNVVIFADTCHAGKLITRGDGDRAISIVPQLEKMRKEEQVPKGWIFMVGAETDRQAVEHASWTHGAFTHVLLKGLAGEADGFESAGLKDGVVSLGELRAYLTATMPDETQKVLGVAKHPLIVTSTGDPSIWELSLRAR